MPWRLYKFPHFMPGCQLIVQTRQLQQSTDTFLGAEKWRPKTHSLQSLHIKNLIGAHLLSDASLTLFLFRKEVTLGYEFSWTVSCFSPHNFLPKPVWPSPWMGDLQPWEAGVWAGPGLALACKEATDAARFQRATLTDSSGVFEMDWNIQYRSLQQNSCMRNNVNPLPLIG